MKSEGYESKRKYIYQNANTSRSRLLTGQKPAGPNGKTENRDRNPHSIKRNAGEGNLEHANSNHEERERERTIFINGSFLGSVG